MGTQVRTRKLVTPIVGALGAAALVSAALLGSSDAGPHHRHHSGDRSKLAVHEWGTFTVMQGSDGVSLEGMQHEDEVLPSFVGSMTGSTPSVFRTAGVRSRNVPVRRVRSKMETPVLYFHTNKRQRVKVRVDFRKGIINQYYPLPAKQVPTTASPGLDLSKVGESYAEWDLELFPRGRGLNIPKVARGNHYGYAREAKSAYVRAKTPKGYQDEQFVFYRGLGQSVPKVSVDTGASGFNVVRNFSGHAIGQAFMLQVEGNKARFMRLGRIAANGKVNARLRARFAGKGSVVAKLSKQVHRALVAEGLHADEASAMVKTWSKSWFTSQGTRVLYVVPTAYVDDVLPLQITPKPDKVVRVFVGRIEIMTPGEEKRVERILAGLYGRRIDTNSPQVKRLASLGRFLEPKVRRVMARTGNRAVRIAGKRVLAAMQRANRVSARRGR